MGRTAWWVALAMTIRTTRWKERPLCLTKNNWYTVRFKSERSLTRCLTQSVLSITSNLEEDRQSDSVVEEQWNAGPYYDDPESQVPMWMDDQSLKRKRVEEEDALYTMSSEDEDCDEQAVMRAAENTYNADVEMAVGEESQNRGQSAARLTTQVSWFTLPPILT